MLRSPTLNRGLSLLAIAGLVTVVVSLASLHFLRPDLEPRSSHLSYYAVGRYAWLMTLSFLAAAVGVASLTATLWRTISRSLPRSLGCSALLLASVTYVALAVFVTDVQSASEIEPVRTFHGQVHDVAARVHGLAWLLVAAITPIALGRDDRWKRTRPWSIVGSVAIALTVAARVLSSAAWAGLTQRIWIGVVLAWALGHALLAGRSAEAAASHCGAASAQ